MNSWPFVIAAYVITLVGAGGVSLWAWHAMWQAERAADAQRERR